MLLVGPPDGAWTRALRPHWLTGGGYVCKSAAVVEWHPWCAANPTHTPIGPAGAFFDLGPLGFSYTFSGLHREARGRASSPAVERRRTGGARHDLSVRIRVAQRRPWLNTIHSLASRPPFRRTRRCRAGWSGRAATRPGRAPHAASSPTGLSIASSLLVVRGIAYERLSWLCFWV